MEYVKPACWSSVVFALLFCAANSSFAQPAPSPTPPQDDVQNWNEVQFIVPLSPRLELTFTGQLRIGRDLTRPVSERGGASLDLSAGEYLSFSAGYLYVASQPFAGQKDYENRLLFSGTVRLPPLRRFTISNRNLVEVRLRNSRANSTRYRNRVQVDRPVEIRGFRLGLFASDEVFYDFSLNRWSRNRFSAGVSRRFSDRYTGDVYYLRQNDGFSRPGDLHIIGTTLRVHF